MRKYLVWHNRRSIPIEADGYRVDGDSRILRFYHLGGENVIATFNNWDWVEHVIIAEEKA